LKLSISQKFHMSKTRLKTYGATYTLAWTSSTTDKYHSTPYLNVNQCPYTKALAILILFHGNTKIPWGYTSRFLKNIITSLSNGYIDNLWLIPFYWHFSTRTLIRYMPGLSTFATSQNYSIIFVYIRPPLATKIKFDEMLCSLFITF